MSKVHRIDVWGKFYDLHNPEEGEEEFPGAYILDVEHFLDKKGDKEFLLEIKYHPGVEFYFAKLIYVWRYGDNDPNLGVIIPFSDMAKSKEEILTTARRIIRSYNILKKLCFDADLEFRIFKKWNNKENK